jgi:uncharacterized membrane protein YbhN (UPF0104 family)
VSGATSADRPGVLPEPRGKSIAPRWLRPLFAIPTPIIFVAAAAIATALLWRQGALGDIAASIQNVSPWAIAAILAAYAGSVLVLGLRWHILVRMAGGEPSWPSSVEVFLTSVIVNYAAPIGLAVPTRAALTVRDLGLTASQSAAVVAWELGLDVAALSLVAAAWLVLGGATLLQTIPIDERAVIVFGLGVSVAAVVAVIAKRAVWRRPAWLGSVRQALLQPVRDPALAALAVTTTALFWGTQMGVMAALLHLFGATPSMPLLFGIMGLPILLGMLSPVPGGAGVREALMVAAAGLERAPAGPVVLAAVAYRLTLFVVTPLVWGLTRVVDRWNRHG